MSARALVIGGGGREHAIVEALSRAASRPEILCAPGNPGIARLAETIAIKTDQTEKLVELAVSRAVDLVIIGPEAPLLAGLADALRARGIVTFGPSAAAAALEGSKAFSKSIMREAGVPTAESETFEAIEPAIAWAAARGGKVAVKADGLAGGKGVVVADDLATAEAAIRSFLGGALGDAGRRLVIEEKLEGEEVSLLAITDGTRAVLLPAAQDHKRVFDGDSGPNTGAMGAYSPAPCLADASLPEIRATCIDPVLAVMRARGTPFTGVLYAGLMLTPNGVRVLEYNARFGDPETQAILPRVRDDLYVVLYAAASGQLDRAALDVDPRAALAVVLASENYPGTPATGDAILGLDSAEGLVFHAGTERTVDGRVVTAGGRVLAVTALGGDLRAARDAAYATAAGIRWRGQHFRKDIGARAL